MVEFVRAPFTEKAILRYPASLRYLIHPKSFTNCKVIEPLSLVYLQRLSLLAPEKNTWKFPSRKDALFHQITHLAHRASTIYS